MGFDWKSLVKTVAPVLGAAVGGPLGGIAVQAIGSALGLSDATEETIANTLAGAKPEDLLKLKQADQQFAKDMKALDVDLEKSSTEAVTSRWQADMSSDNKLSKNVRPGVLVYLTFILTVFALGSAYGMNIQDAYIKLIGDLLMLVYGAYFLGRSAEKITNITKK